MPKHTPDKGYKQMLSKRKTNFDAGYVVGTEAILKSYINEITLIKAKNQRED